MITLKKSFKNKLLTGINHILKGLKFESIKDQFIKKTNGSSKTKNIQ